MSSWNESVQDFLTHTLASSDQTTLTPKQRQNIIEKGNEILRRLMHIQNQNVTVPNYEEEKVISERGGVQGEYASDIDPIMAWDLLDRLVALEGRGKGEGGKALVDLRSRHLWTSNCLNVVLLLWRNKYRDAVGNADHISASELPTPSQIIERMNQYRTCSSCFISDVQSFNIILDCAAIVGELHVAQQLYQWMWKESERDPLLKPNLVSIRTLFKALICHSDGPDQCEQLVDEWIQKYKMSPQGLESALIHVWALEDPNQAKVYLKGMTATSISDPTAECPDTVTWNRVMSAYAAHYEQPDVAAELLEDFWVWSDRLKGQKMESLTTRAIPEPDLFSYNIILDGWARIGNATKAEELLRAMQVSSATRPNVMSYTSVLQAYGSNVGEVERIANDCLEAYLKQEQSDADHGSRPLKLDQGLFHTWLRACISDNGNVPKAMEVLEQMKRVSLQPDRLCYYLLLECFLQRDDVQGATKFLLDYGKTDVQDERVLVHWTRKLYEIGDISISTFFQKLLSSKSTSLLQILIEKRYISNPESLERLVSQLPLEQGRQILQWMDHPTRQVYTILCKSFAQRGMAETVEEIVQGWLDQDDDNDISSDMYTSLVVAFSERGDLSRTMHWYALLRKEQGVSSPIAPTAVLSCCSKATQPRRAEEFLKEFSADFHLGRTSIAPDVVMHNIILNTWSRVGNGKRAQEYLESHAMDEIRDIVSFNTVVQAYVKEHRVDLAEAFVQSMIREGPVMPDVSTFRTLLSGCVKSKGKKDYVFADQANRFLNWMNRLYEDGTLADPPDSHCYELVLEAWSDSGHPKSGKHAESIIQEMISKGIQPKVSAYVKLMKALRRAPTRSAAVLNEMQSAFLKGDCLLMPDDRAFSTVLSVLVSRRGTLSKADALLRDMIRLKQSGQLVKAPEKRHFDWVLQAYSRWKDTNSAEIESC